MGFSCNHFRQLSQKLSCFLYSLLLLFIFKRCSTVRWVALLSIWHIQFSPYSTPLHCISIKNSTLNHSTAISQFYSISWILFKGIFMPLFIIIVSFQFSLQFSISSILMTFFRPTLYQFLSSWNFSCFSYHQVAFILIFPYWTLFCSATSSFKCIFFLL